MEFSDEKILFLMKSSAMSLTCEEQEGLKVDLKKIFTYIESLKQVPTEHVQACTHPLSHVCNIVRDDILEPTLDKQAFLSNSPAHIASMVRVPTIIHKD